MNIANQVLTTWYVNGPASSHWTSHPPEQARLVPGRSVLGVARYLQEPVIFQPENTRAPRTDVRGLVSLTGVSCEELA